MSKMGRHVLEEQEKQINNSVSRFAVCILGDDIIDLTKTISNDQELGTKVRALVAKYKGKNIIHKRQQG
tara:strand:+ start:942 stop:1148 length:207 start_codon:yes stop_codon:yes gene_type:complete